MNRRVEFKVTREVKQPLVPGKTAPDGEKSKGGKP
jgi:hypothetical protein